MRKPAALLGGPKLSPASGGPAKQLVVLLHGYGADGNDLIGLGEVWSRLLPDAAFASPHAPEPCAANPFGGRQWFELTFRDPEERWRGVNNAEPALNAWLDDELSRLGLDGSALALAGFSQGAMMALHCGFRRNPPPAAVIGFSGLLAGPDHFERDIASRGGGVLPPVLLIHGDRDEVIPVEALAQARGVLARIGANVQWSVRPGLGHGIDGEGLDMAGRFLAAAFSAGSNGAG